MTGTPRLKAALLAAASFAAAAGATQTASAAHAAPAHQISIAAHVAAPDDERAPIAPIAKTAGLAALAAAALGFAAHLLGRENLQRAARAVAAAPAAAARAVGSFISAPVRFLMVFGVLAIVGFAGIGALNLEWAAGLMIGAALVGLVWVGARRVGALARVRNGRR
jgi:hypothetical protein